METAIDLSAMTTEQLHTLIAKAYTRLAEIKAAEGVLDGEALRDSILNTPTVREIELGQRFDEKNNETVFYMINVYGTEALGYIASFEEWFARGREDHREFVGVRFDTCVYPTIDEALADALPNARKETEKELNPAPKPEPEPEPEPMPARKTWRDDPPTEKQISRLRSFGIDAAGLTKGQASDLISYYKENQANASPMVECWECGCLVPQSKAIWDGHAWYCGC